MPSYCGVGHERATPIRLLGARKIVHRIGRVVAGDPPFIRHRCCVDSTVISLPLKLLEVVAYQASLPKGIEEPESSGRGPVLQPCGSPNDTPQTVIHTITRG